MTAALKKTSLFLITWLLCSPLLAQEKLPPQLKVSLDYKKVTLKEAFNHMSRQTGYTFTYGDRLINAKETFAIHVSNAPLEKVLNQLLRERGLDFGVVSDDKSIVIRKANGQLPAARPEHAEPQPVEVQTIVGKVTDSLNAGLVATTVSIKGSSRALATDESGNFIFPGVPVPSILVFRQIGYEAQELKWDGQHTVHVILKESIQHIEDVSVASTGYQQIKRSRSTGSYTVIGNNMLNRSVSTSILDRLKGVAGGVLFDNNTGNDIGITIRGRSTIFGNATPLIVLDNYPYEGALDDINPNDIESITILKDAVAAAIWGTRAGNGVIVIQSKKGVLATGPVVNFSSNFTSSAKPDLYHRAQLSSAEYIDVQQFLFSKGYFSGILDYQAVNPAVQIMLDRKNGLISFADSAAQINVLKQQDVRDDLTKYFYQRTFNQQYQVNVKGGTARQTYYLSAGYDNNRQSNVGASYQRYSLKGNYALALLNKKLNITSDLFFTSTRSNEQAMPYTPAYPFAKLADASGNALAVVIPGVGLRASYTDTAGGGKLLDWKYRPLDELNNKTTQNKTGITDYRINLTVAYQILKGLTVSGNYQLNKAVTDRDVVLNGNSYDVRNNVNTFTQIDRVNNTIVYPFPKGDVWTNNNTDLHSHFVRFQANYEKELANLHTLNVIAGYELRSQDKEQNAKTLYGYNPATGTSVPVNYTIAYPYYYNSNSAKIANSDTYLGIYERDRSVYGSVSYSYNKKYIFTGSIRKDESNLFGVNANQKGVPLWSAGLGWMLSKERFYTLTWLPYVKLSASYGYNGNVDNSLSAYLTLQSIPGAANMYGNSYFTVNNPPNPSLGWERVRNINILLDFATRNNRIAGTIEWYNKNGLDLIGNAPGAGQTGVAKVRGNSANINGQGVDVQLSTLNVNKKVKWETSLLFNYNAEKVKDYKQKAGVNSEVVQSTYTSDPLIGYPVRSVFAYRFAGLDTMGRVVGYVDGKPSIEYATIQNSTNRSDLRFYGSLLPRVFGSLMNTFSYKRMTLSFNLIYKFDYYFRRQALDYSSLFSGSFYMPDFSKRWQKKGDELTTTVPAMQAPPLSTGSDLVYAYSEALVEKGDHVRLQDIQLSVVVSKNKRPSFPFKNVVVNVYASNLGIIWRANKKGLDPEALTVPLLKNYSVGLKAEF